MRADGMSGVGVGTKCSPCRQTKPPRAPMASSGANS